MAMILKLLAAIAVAGTLLPPSYFYLVDQVRTYGLVPDNYPLSVLGGMACGALVVWWRKPNWLVHTFIHECCHAIMCLALFVRVKGFMASGDKGGYVTHIKTDPLRTILIAIAPYTLPLLLAPALFAFHWVTDPLWKVIWGSTAGFLYVHHLHALYHNVRRNFWGHEADLVRVGRPLSLALISTALIWTTVWTHVWLFK